MKDETLNVEVESVDTGVTVVIEEQSPAEDRAVAEESEPLRVKRPSPMTLPLLLEVGCEEIPARFLANAEKALGERVQAALIEARLLPAGKKSDSAVTLSEAEAASISDELEDRVKDGDSLPEAQAQTGALSGAPTVITYSTPRRLVVHAPVVLSQQPDKVEELIGPPLKVAIDSAGKYTRAAESFAQKNGAPVEDLVRTNTPRGEYLSLRKTTPGRPARGILAEILPGAILGIRFPKSMYWTEKTARRFIRPIRWVVALLGERKSASTIDFEIVGVKSGNFTFGHRGRSRKPLLVTGFKDYAKKLAQAHVKIDPAGRMDSVSNGISGLAEGIGCRTVIDPGLEEWVVNSTEWPRPILGNFDERFLHLPREILITVMRGHQKYFAVEDQQGSLRPHFVTVLNTEPDEKGLMRRGHERVLTARFRDAEFFWNADQRIPLRERLPLLEKVTYQAKLGSYGDKVRRMERVGRGVSAVLLNRERLTASGQEKIGQAIRLAKCDLTTQMVQEFPELQGVVGGLYARFQGEDAEIAQAIADHYAPQGTSDLIPRTLVGGVVALADKLDAVTSGFVAGLAPTGSSDPFGLRRQTNGIVIITVELHIDIELRTQVLDIIDAFAFQRHQHCRYKHRKQTHSPMMLLDSSGSGRFLSWRGRRASIRCGESSARGAGVELGAGRE